MRRTTPIYIRLDVKSTVQFFRRNWCLLLLSFSLLCGIFLGSLTLDIPVFSQLKISGTFTDFLTSRQNSTFFLIFRASFSAVFCFIIVSFLSGLFVFGTPITLIIPFVRGIGLGVSGGYLYTVYGFKGVAFWIFIMLPHCFISSVAIILACKSAFSLSGSMLQQIKKSPPALLLNKNLKSYCMKYILILLIAFVSSFLDALLSSLFIGVFSF